MRLLYSVVLIAGLTACGGAGGNNASGLPISGSGGGGEDRQVLVDLAKRACSERLDLRPNFETAAAQRGCDCAIDQLYAGKSGEEIVGPRRTRDQDAAEERAAEQCLAGGR